MEEIVLFFMAFIVVLVLYHLFVIKKAKKGDLDKLPTEVMYIKHKYNLHVDKSNYKKILNTVAIVSSFDIALIVSLTLLVNNFFLQLLVIIISSPIIFLISYHLVGKNFSVEDKNYE